MNHDLLAIEALDLEPFDFRLRQRFHNARSEWTERHGVRLYCASHDLVGYGEASPLPGFSAETREDAVRDLTVAAARVRTLRMDLPPLEAVDAATISVGPLVPSARFALETALLDLRAKAAGVPMWRLLRAPSMLGTPASIRLSSLVAGDEAEMLRAAEHAAQRGIRCVKMKIGRHGAHAAEVRAATALRGALGDTFGLRFDANGAWSAGNAAARLAEFAAVVPEMVEEPVSGREWLALDRAAGLPPLAVDETLASAASSDVLDDVLSRRFCVAAVLKLSVLGGFLRARAIEARVRAAGLDVVVTHAFEGPIATAAAAAFALGLEDHPRAAGLDVRAYADDDWPADHPIGQAAVVAHDAPGLGIGHRR